jgi:hypothetical protein
LAGEASGIDCTVASASESGDASAPDKPRVAQ